MAWPDPPSAALGAAPPGSAAGVARADLPARWTDPRLAAGYAARADALDRRLAWPELIAAVSPREPRRAPGRPDGTVLDFGCGLGLMAHDLVGGHWVRAIAVDLSPTLHRLGALAARDAWLTRTVPDRTGRIPTRTAQCTAASAHLVFTHLAHLCLVTAALTEIRRSVRRGSPLVFTEPGAVGVDFPGLRWGEPGEQVAEGGVFAAHYRAASGATVSIPAYRHSARQLTGCLNAAGFTVREIRALADGGGPGCADDDRAPFVFWRAEAG